MPLPVSAIRTLREERQQLASDAREILKRYPEGEEFSPGDETRWDEIHQKDAKLKRRIEREEELRDREIEIREAELRAAESRGTLAGRHDAGGRDHDRRDFASNPGHPTIGEPHNPAVQLSDAEARAAMTGWLRHGVSGLTAEQRKTLLRQSADLPPEARAMATGVDAVGGFAVPIQFETQITSAMKKFGGLLQTRVDVFHTASGGDIPFVTEDDTQSEGEFVGEGQKTGTQDPKTGLVVLRSYLLSSKIVKVHVNLLQDAFYDVVAHVNELLGKRMGRRLSRALTNGQGSTEPMGLVPAAQVGHVALVSQAVSADEMIDLKHSVDPSYRTDGEFIFNDQSFKGLKKLKDADGRPLWQSNLALRAPDTFDDDPFTIVQSMDDIAPGKKPIAYGDLANYKVRFTGQTILVRLSEKYADEFMVGFLAFRRVDANLVDAGTGPVKTLQMPN